MLKAIQDRVDRCHTWEQPHEDITWLLARVAELETALAMMTNEHVVPLRERITALEAQCDTLLAACEAARSVMGGGSRFLSNEEMLALDLLDAAIAKAQFGPWRDLKSYSENDMHVLRTHATALKAERDHWRNLVDDLEQNGIYLDSKAYYEGRIAELETAIALSISDINCGRVDSARDRLFEIAKPDKRNNA